MTVAHASSRAPLEFKIEHRASGRRLRLLAVSAALASRASRHSRASAAGASRATPMARRPAPAQYDASAALSRRYAFGDFDCLMRCRRVLASPRRAGVAPPHVFQTLVPTITVEYSRVHRVASILGRLLLARPDIMPAGYRLSPTASLVVASTPAAAWPRLVGAHSAAYRFAEAAR